jgi:hypothetical protein
MRNWLSLRNRLSYSAPTLNARALMNCLRWFSIWFSFISEWLVTIERRVLAMTNRLLASLVFYWWPSEASEHSFGEAYSYRDSTVTWNLTVLMTPDCRCSGNTVTVTAQVTADPMDCVCEGDYQRFDAHMDRGVLRRKANDKQVVLLWEVGQQYKLSFNTRWCCSV